MWYIYTEEYYSAIKRNGALTHAAMQMNFGNMTLDERSQTGQKEAPQPGRSRSSAGASGLPGPSSFVYKMFPLFTKH